MSEKKEVVYKNMVYYCPVCGSKKITMNMSAVLNKQTDANTGKDIDTSKKQTVQNEQQRKGTCL